MGYIPCHFPLIFGCGGVQMYMYTSDCSFTCTKLHIWSHYFALTQLSSECSFLNKCVNLKPSPASQGSRIVSVWCIYEAHMYM